MTSQQIDPIYTDNTGETTQNQQDIPSNSSPDLNPLTNNSQTVNAQPVFYPIIDVATEMHRRNFLPALHCLRYNLIPRDFMDHTGYNMLHHAVSQGSIPITLLLLDYYKIDVNSRSRNNQTSLMIACNYGLTEIIRILLERGAQVNPKDDTNFSALLYSVKFDKVPQVAYLLHHKADYNVTDVNGCTVVHWAAFRNHVFLLEMFQRIGFNINQTDNQGLTPLQRAIQGESYDTLEYLLENGDSKIPSNLKVEDIVYPDIKNLIRKKFFPTKYEEFQNKAIALFKKSSQKATFIVYINLWFLMMGMFFSKIRGRTHWYIFDLLFFFFSLYFIIFTYFYYLKSNTVQKKKKIFSYEKLYTADESLDTSTDKIQSQLTPKLNSEILDKLVQGEQHGTVIHEVEQESQSFLHELAWNFETKNYREIARFDSRDYCAKCLQKRPERSFHPKESKTCVPQFHHYSYCLGRSVDGSNHYLYLTQLVNQMIMLVLFFVGVWSSIESYYNPYIWFLEAWIKLVEESRGILQWHGTIYLILGVLAMYNFVFLWIELYGIATNTTYHELFNRNKCNYMFELKTDRQGNIVKYYNNPYDVGFVKNVKQYINRILH